MADLDTDIVRAAIYPAIGIARVGNSEEEFFIGPETIARQRREAAFYKDAKGALKRQAARFRIFGLNKDGIPVKELTSDDAAIRWRVHVGNRKAAWYEFDVALDIPQANPVTLRNANFQGADRAKLFIDPGEIEISGKNEKGAKYRFDRGSFIGTSVYLGELQTDDAGRLLFLGGHGLSRTPYANNPPTTFANNNGWHDDTSDGPVDAEVTYEGKKLPVVGAWVVCAPPNYAPDVISVQTMYDVIVDTLMGYYIAPKPKPSFMHDIYPLLAQFSDNQWVNKGFFVGYGRNQAYDFTNPVLLARLSQAGKDYAAYRTQIFNYFRPPNPAIIIRELWPWMYGDNMAKPPTTPNAFMSVTNTIYGYLKQWAAGDFIEDYDPAAIPKEPQSLEEIATAAGQAEMLTKSALWYCLGGPFHPGCEMTWPMRVPGMYTAAFRIRRRTTNNPEPEPAPILSPSIYQNGEPFTTPPPELWNGPGDLTRWMAVPWQTDTASCRAGYEPEYDPLIPTFWPARVPNTVLKQSDYEIVVDTAKPMQERLDAFNRRASWYRILGPNYLNQIQNMIDRFGDLGVVGYKPGVADDPQFPPEMYVESPPYAAGTPMPQAKGIAAAVDARQLLADRAEAEVPDDQGLVVGSVGRAARRR